MLNKKYVIFIIIAEIQKNNVSKLCSLLKIVDSFLSTKEKFINLDISVVFSLVHYYPFIFNVVELKIACLEARRYGVQTIYTLRSFKRSVFKNTQLLPSKSNYFPFHTCTIVIDVIKNTNTDKTF